MFFDLRIDTRPAGQRLRRSTRPVTLASVSQPDDRPRQPLTAHNWVTVPPVPLATERRSSRPRGWAGVVAGFDDSSAKVTVQRSSEIRPPVLRDYDTPGRATKAPINPAPTPPRAPMNGPHWVTYD